MARAPVPLYYVLLSGARGTWANLIQIEADAGFRPASHPHRRQLLSDAERLGHLETMQVGKRTLYRLTPLGEAYLDAAFEVYGPVDRFAFDAEGPHP